MEQIINACKSKVDKVDAKKISAALAQIEANNAKVSSKQKEVTGLEEELRETLKQEGSWRDAQLLKVYGALVAEIADKIRSVCASQDEALLIARGMEIPTNLHSTLCSWRRGVDLENCAYNFLTFLRATIPSIQGD